MFTGLVQALGTVTAVEPSTDGVRLTVAAPLAAELRAGDSVAVNGVCLTAVDPSAERGTPQRLLHHVGREASRRHARRGQARAVDRH